MSRSGRLVASVVFLTTVFLSAFLLFQVQPLISKYILPWFGGSPAVWTTCMLFFQVALFGGYLYAHLLVSKLSPKAQAGLHLTLVVVAACLLPIAPDSAWKPTDANDPVGRILLLLAVTVGLPYFVLSTTGPLLQGWFAKTLPGASPYRLYALSNVGSLLALLSYPFVVEPRWAAEQQALFWSIGFGVFVVLCAACAILALMAKPTESATLAASQTVDTSTPIAPTGTMVWLWIALAAVPSAMLLAITNQVCTDIAVVPFLWVIPLALYLLTFILCFDSDRWYHRRLFGAGLLLSAAGVCFLLWDSAMNWGMVPQIVVQATIYFALLFCSCMVCHGELVALKPEPRHLTKFYLCLSLGGALGGLFVGLAAPSLFQTLLELPIAIVAACALLLVVMLRESQSGTAGDEARPLALNGALAVFILALGGCLWGQSQQVTRNALASDRNFYGILRVHQALSSTDSKLNAYVLRHGQIRHGHQFQHPDRRRIASTYYGPDAGGGIAVGQHRLGQNKRVGVVGLGAGTLAVYGQPGDYYRMYEINPAVVSMAKDYFTYLSDCKATCDVVVADGRIALEQEEPQRFDVLVLDAFSGDAVPAHLLTRECGELYLKHLQSDGILACHITNRHVDLRPVCAGLAQQFDLQTLALLGPKDRDTGVSTSIWVLISRNADSLQTLRLGKARQITMGAEPILWTDAFSNLLSVLQPNGMQFQFVSGKQNVASKSGP